MTTTGKNIVICCDGTGNEIGTNISNVLKLFRCLTKSDQQRVYYSPGIGTIALSNAWQRFRQRARGVFGMVTGQGLDEEVLAAYEFLCRNHEPGDRIWLFGFSRGAYTVRVLAAFIHVMGLFPPDQLNLAPRALTAYKRASAASGRAKAAKFDEAAVPETSGELMQAWQFARIADGRFAPIEFVGVWDTVASVIVPRSDRFWLPDLQTLRFTRTNPSVKTFRHAMAVDERRRMFRLNAWTEPQVFRPKPFLPSSAIPQDIKQVWFAGVHADIGGGYPETESALSKFPLKWMIDEAAAKGLKFNTAFVNNLALGQPRKGSKMAYVAPDPAGPVHQSLTLGWRLIEWLPKSIKLREWSKRPGFLGLYIPWGEPRFIAPGASIDASVRQRKVAVPSYRPSNL
jgi:uncharacterized protein (DUF2235 family)